MTAVAVRDVIAVHPPFAALVDWARVCVASQRWAIVTTAASRDALVHAGLDRRFRAVVALDVWGEEALSDAVAALLRGCDELASTRLATMIEPMMLPVARLRERFGVPGDGVKDVEPFVDKVVMKRAMRGVDALLPPWIAHDPEAMARAPGRWLDRVIAAVGLPAFAKPTAEHSSAGTARIDSREALQGYLEAARGPVEVEAFIEADVYHLDAVVIDGVVRWFGAGRYLRPPAESLRGAPLAGITVPVGSPRFDALRRLHDTLLGAFARVPDGCTHLEVLHRRRDDRWYFLELAARTPGWRIPEQHQIHQGLDLRAVHYQVQSGQRPDLTTRAGPHAAFYAPLKTRPGHITAVREAPFVSPHRWEWFASWRERADVVRAATMGDFLGAAVLWNDDLDALEADLARLVGFDPYRIEGEP